MEIFFLCILIILMATALGSGFPVAFALPGAAILSIGLAAGSGYLFAGDVDSFFHSGGPGQWLSAGVTNLRGVYWEVERDTLIAIPLFIFMGIMLQRSKIAEDLLVTMAQLFGPVPGGLGISVVFVGALLAATTGIVGATVVAMGLISLPAMLRNKYSPELATGAIAASGTLGQIIPPSIVLIILADQLASAVDQASTARKALYKAATGEFQMPSELDVASTSAGEMFLGAFLPGLVLVVLYMVFILIYAILKPSAAPTVRHQGKNDLRFFGRVLLTLVPPLALIFLVLGSIIAGIATVNQAGAVGAAGALIMAGYRLRPGGRLTYVPALLCIAGLIGVAFVLANFDMNVKRIDDADDSLGITLGVIFVMIFLTGLVWSGWRAYRVDNTLHGVMVETAKTTSLVFIILLGAAMLTAAFRAFGGEDLVREFLQGLPGGFWSQFIIVMAVIFVLGFFLDFIEIAVVVVPIVAPILLTDPGANVTAVWLGVMIGLNIQTSFLTPPFGFALFYLRGVAPAAVRTVQIYRGVVAFIALQLLALVIVGLNPSLVNYLPQRVSLLSETAPPPRNPRLQLCLEEYVGARLDEDRGAIERSLADARGFDLSFLPEDLTRNFAASIDSTEAAFAELAKIKEADQAVEAAEGAYRPYHLQVRRIEKEVLDLKEQADELRLTGQRLRGDEFAARRAEIEERRQALLLAVETLEATKPGNWDQIYNDFAALQRADEQLRTEYRRSADQGYRPVGELAAVLRGTPEFRELGDDIRELRGNLDDEAEDLARRADRLAERAGEIPEASPVQAALRDARDAFGSETPDAGAGAAALDAALAEIDAQMDWRDRADRELTEKFLAYDEMLIDTTGARSQNRMTEDQALFVAACESGHRDMSLKF